MNQEMDAFYGAFKSTTYVRRGRRNDFDSIAPTIEGTTEYGKGGISSSSSRRGVQSMTNSNNNKGGKEGGEEPQSRRGVMVSMKQGDEIENRPF